jgi:uncharacterized protein (TIGR03083 family)
MTDATDALFLDSLRADRSAIAALAATDLSAAVAACPGWTLADLLRHVGAVQRWATAAMTVPPDVRPQFPHAEVGDDAVFTWFDDGMGALIAAFHDHDLDKPCWTFIGAESRRWWLRRQALEAAVHRWDAESTAGLVPRPIEGDLAVTGVDEWCELESIRWFSPSPDLDASFHLHATDGDGEWLVEARPAGFSWSRGHQKGDVAVRGSRSDLFLAVWHRIGADDLEVFGDPTLWRSLLAATAV